MEAVDREAGIAVKQVDGPTDIRWGELTFSLHGRVAIFDAPFSVSALERSEKTLDYPVASGVLRRLAYRLRSVFRSKTQ